MLKVMAVSESSRLYASLKKESVPVKRLIVNQVLPPSATDCKFCTMKRKVSLQSGSISLYFPHYTHDRQFQISVLTNLENWTHFSIHVIFFFILPFGSSF